MTSPNIDFTEIKHITIPECTDGVEVAAIECGSDTLWKLVKARYVSLGDSIAAGHTIVENWDSLYGGTGNQVGNNGKTETFVIPDTYTARIHKLLCDTYGSEYVVTKSFARSGQTVGGNGIGGIIEMINQNPYIQNEIARADYITVCIGANEVLEPAMSNLGLYFDQGQTAIATLRETVRQNCARLGSKDGNQRSYWTLFNLINSLNKHGKIVFSTVYNPYKYLHLDEGTNGFFKPLLDYIPGVLSGVKDSILSHDMIRTLFDRANNLPSIAEEFVSAINTELIARINEFKQINPNFAYADSKLIFDGVPNRPEGTGTHYNDLVSVEYTSGYTFNDMDWGRLYNQYGGAGDYWWRVIGACGLDVNAIVEFMTPEVIQYVIVPDVDPHPEAEGHRALYRSFCDAFATIDNKVGWPTLPKYTLRYYRNHNSSDTVCTTLVLPAFDSRYWVTIPYRIFDPAPTYYFTGWDIDNNADDIVVYGGGNRVELRESYSYYSKWSNMYTITYKHREDSDWHGSDQTGPMENYEFWLAGTANNQAGKPEDKLGAFSNPARYFTVPYGTAYGIVVRAKYGKSRSYISKNGVILKDDPQYFLTNGTSEGKGTEAKYNGVVRSHIILDFEWTTEGMDLGFVHTSDVQSYWNCYITEY